MERGIHALVGMRAGGPWREVGRTRPLTSYHVPEESHNEQWLVVGVETGHRQRKVRFLRRSSSSPTTALEGDSVQNSSRNILARDRRTCKEASTIVAFHASLKCIGIDSQPKTLQTEMVLAEPEQTPDLPVVVQSDTFSYREQEKVLVTIACRWLFGSICIHFHFNRAMVHSHLLQAERGGCHSPILVIHLPHLSFDLSPGGMDASSLPKSREQLWFTQGERLAFLPSKEPSRWRMLFRSMVRIFAPLPFGFSVHTLLSFVFFGLETDG